MNRPEVKAFVEYQMNPANKKLVAEAGYVPLPDEIYTASQARLGKGVIGSVFNGKKAIGVKLADLLKAETAAPAQ
jgi:phosphate transport system substrate-binding protein